MHLEFWWLYSTRKNYYSRLETFFIASTIFEIEEKNDNTFILFIRWTPKRNLRYGRCHANLMAVGHSLFLCGGVSIDRSSPEPELTSVADVDEYDVTTDTWVLKTCLLKERHDACCVKSGMYMYVKIKCKNIYKSWETIAIPLYIYYYIISLLSEALTITVRYMYVQFEQGYYKLLSNEYYDVPSTILSSCCIIRSLIGVNWKNTS